MPPKNAAILAVEMISLKDKDLEKKLIQMKEDMAKKVIESDEAVKKEY